MRTEIDHNKINSNVNVQFYWYEKMVKKLFTVHKKSSSLKLQQILKKRFIFLLNQLLIFKTKQAQPYYAYFGSLSLHM